MRFVFPARGSRALSCVLFASAALWCASAAQAAVTISDKPTSNMSCTGGMCSPTAKKANLNVTDLANLLAAGDTMVISDSAANDIEFKAPLSWTSTTRLTLDAYRSIVFQQPVTVAGTGALTITTNDGGVDGDFSFEKKGHVKFLDLQSSLTINGNAYTLVQTIKQLAKAVKASPSGSFALAKDYDAAKDAPFPRPPIEAALVGTFEGLGNAFSDVSIHDPDNDVSVGFFASVGSVHNARFSNIEISATGSGTSVGGISGAGENIAHSVVTGSISATGGVGGLVGFTGGGLTDCYTSVDVSSVAGPASGLVGTVYGAPQQVAIRYSDAVGPVAGGDNAFVGGLIGIQQQGYIFASYAKGTVTGGQDSNVGGLTGISADALIESYSTGAVTGSANSYVGGLIGETYYTPYSSDYWDIDTSGTDEGTGNGNVYQVTGLTTKQFTSGLPDGFDPSIWGQSANINNGYPYLLANPPPKK